MFVNNLTIFLIIVSLLFVSAGVIFYLRLLKADKQKSQKSIDEQNRALLASQRLNKIILESLDFDEVVQKIANTIPKELFFGIGVVSLIDEEKRVIRRIAASKTKEAVEAIEALEALKIPFTQIEISLDDPNNLMVKAVKENKTFITENVYDVLGPVLTKEEAQIIQNIMGTKTTLVLPIYGTKNKPMGVFLVSTKKRKQDIFEYEQEMIRNFVDGVGIAIEHAHLYQKIKNVSEELKISNESLQERNKAFAATNALNTIILQTLDFDLLTQRTANAIPQFLGYQTGVLAIVDEQKQVLKRVSISETTGGRVALQSLEVPFKNIEISLSDKENYCVKALREGKKISTDRLYDVLRPTISEENSALVQKTMGTKTTLIYPIYSVNKKPLGTFLVSMNKEEKDISDYEYQTISNFIDGVRIALVNATLYTSLKKTTERLGVANEKLKELDKLKDDFVSVASHELRTPMTAIKSYLWMALAGKAGDLNEKMKKYLERAYISTDRLINLVNDMLNLSRIEDGRIELKLAGVDLLGLARDILEEVKPKAEEKQLQVSVVDYEDLPLVLADGNKIREVITNLLGNALKFTPAGGKITINFSPKDGFIETSVTDTGKGIAPEDISRLFAKFGRLNHSYVAAAETGGTGLGLYISKALVQLHKGTIRAESEGVGKGATFIFSLPVAKIEDIKNLGTYDPEKAALEDIGPGGRGIIPTKKF